VSHEILLRHNVPLLDDTVYEYVDGNHLFYLSNINSEFVSPAKNIFLMGKAGPGPAVGGTDADTRAISITEGGDYNFSNVSGLPCQYDFTLFLVFYYDGPDPNYNYYITPTLVEWNGEQVFPAQNGGLTGFYVSGNTFNLYSLTAELDGFETIEIDNFVKYKEENFGWDCSTWKIYEQLGLKVTFQKMIETP